MCDAPSLKSVQSYGWACRHGWAADGRNGERLHDAMAMTDAVPKLVPFLAPLPIGESNHRTSLPAACHVAVQPQPSVP